MRKIYFSCLLLWFSQVLLIGNNGVTGLANNLPGSAANFAKRSCLVIDNLGNKWVGFNSGAPSAYELIRYNDTLFDAFTHIPSHKVNAIAVDALNNLWLGTDSGLVMFDGITLTKYSMFTSNIPSNHIISVACGGGKVYVGTNNGLSVFNGSNFTNYNTTSGMSNDTVLCITYESSSVIWLGNAKGLEKFNNINTFTYYNVTGTSVTDKVFCIYIDQNNNKWLGTNANGVVEYDNTFFFNTQQLYGGQFIIGGKFPKSAHSICRGPNGGVFFTLVNNAGSMAAGCIELLPGLQANVYLQVGYFQNSLNGYSFYQYDPNTNDIFFTTNNANVNAGVFLFKFDATQYNTQGSINANNTAYLDINNVAALISSNDDMHWDGSSARYYVPKTEISCPIFASSLWIGGYHNGNLHTAAMTYRQSGYDFWPGPLNSTTDTSSTTVSNNFNKLWKINRYDVANFIYNWNAGNVQNGTFAPVPAILSWPGNNTTGYSPSNLAPYVDANSNGIYDPLNDGDYPLIKGDQMIWHVYNDNMGNHSETGGKPFGIEIQSSAYAFVCPAIADSDNVLNNTTFYNFKIINYSQNQYDSCYVMPWMDTDMGNYMDDYIGCDVTNNFGFTYNGDSYDEDVNGLTGYHDNLPALSCLILNGPPAMPGDNMDNNNNGITDEPGEMCLMSNFSYYNNSGNSQTGNPGYQSATQYYCKMKGQWKNGTPVTYGNLGTTPGNPNCRHLFPGMSDPYGVTLGGSISNPISAPISNWTQYNSGLPKGDMRFTIGVGKFSMLPGASYNLDYALVFSRDSAACFNAVDTCILGRMQKDNIKVRNWYNNNSFPSCLNMNGIGVKENTSISLKATLFPNPGNDCFFIELTEAKENVTIEVTDLSGKIVRAGTFKDSQKYFRIPTQELAGGIYLVRVHTGNFIFNTKFIKE